MASRLMRGRSMAGRSVAALGAVVLIAWGLSGCTAEEPQAQPTLADPPGENTTSASGTPTRTFSIEEEIAFEQAEEALRRHIALTNKLGHSPTNKKLQRRLKDTSNGWAYAVEDAKYRLDWGPRGIHLDGVGESGVRSVQPVRSHLTNKRPTVNLRACIDSTHALAVNRKGHPVRKADAPRMALWSVTVMHDPDGMWRVNKVGGSLVTSC
jgi:hypothetical protein